MRRISKRWQFTTLLRSGGSYRGRVIKARYRRNTLGCIRLGYSVSAKTGNAVRRNLFRRRLRQYSVETRVLQGYDAVIFPVAALKDIRWAQMKSDMDELTAMAAKERRNGY